MQVYVITTSKMRLCSVTRIRHARRSSTISNSRAILLGKTVIFSNKRGFVCYSFIFPIRLARPPSQCGSPLSQCARCCWLSGWYCRWASKTRSWRLIRYTSRRLRGSVHVACIASAARKTHCAPPLSLFPGRTKGWEKLMLCLKSTRCCMTFVIINAPASTPGIACLSCTATTCTRTTLRKMR